MKQQQALFLQRIPKYYADRNIKDMPAILKVFMTLLSQRSEKLIAICKIYGQSNLKHSQQTYCLLKYCKIPFHSSQLFMNESFGTNQFFSPIEMDRYRVFPNTKLNLNDLPQQIRLCTLNVCLKFSSANLTFAHEESHRAVRHF